jgi:hypothetical protein
MKKSVLFILIILLMAGIAYGKAFEGAKKSGDYSFEFKMDKNPPVVGKNKIEVVVKDQKGNPITDAKVVVEYSMPAMPGMPAMNYKQDMELKETRYQATIEIAMAGSWTITIKMNRSGKTTSVKFNVDAA